MFTLANNSIFNWGGSQVRMMLDVPSDNGAGGSANDGGSLLTDDIGSQEGSGTDGTGGEDGDGDKGKAGKTTGTWRDALPEDRRNHEAIKDMQKPGDLVESYIKLLEGENKVVLPGEDSTDEDWAEFFGSIGRPDSIDGYNLELSDELPESVKLYIDDEFAAEFKEKAFSAGLRPEQAKAIFEGVSKELSEKAQVFKNELRNATEKQLRKEWKTGFKENMKKSQLALKKLFGEDFAKYLDDTGLGNDPRMIKGCLAAFEEIGEDRIITGGQGEEQQGDGWGKFKNKNHNK